MTTRTDDVMVALEARAERRETRRAFFTQALSVATAAGGAFAIVPTASAQTPTPTPTPAVTDADVLNFALNLEYLEANFYAFAASGAAIPAASQTGVTTSGAQGAATGGRQVNFSDPLVAQYAREIAADELAHVNFLRTALASAAVAQPAIDLSASPTGAFSRAAQAAGVVPAGTAFDPYASDENFLLGAFIFEDVGVTAYKGAAALITNKTFLEAAAGILAVEAYHAAIVRTTLYAKGIATPSAQLIETTERISNARDQLDGNPAADAVRGIAPDDDQGIAPTGSGTTAVSNIVPLNENGLAYSRTTGQVLNIVYLTSAQATMGGFFPAGVNGTIRSSAASA